MQNKIYLFMWYVRVCVYSNMWLLLIALFFSDTNYWFIQRLPLNFSKVPLSALFCGGVINLSLVKAKRFFKLIYSLPFCVRWWKKVSCFFLFTYFVDFWKRKLNYIHKFSLWNNYACFWIWERRMEMWTKCCELIKILQNIEFR